MAQPQYIARPQRAYDDEQAQNKLRDAGASAQIANIVQECRMLDGQAADAIAAALAEIEKEENA